MDGAEVTGVTIIHMDEGIDTGDIILQREVPVLPGETYGSLRERLAMAGASALGEALCLLAEGGAAGRAQEGPFSYAGVITPNDEIIDWGADWAAIINKMRALDPEPGAYTRYLDKKLKIFGAEQCEWRDDALECGAVAGFCRKGFIVKCGDGFLLVTDLQPEGGKRMNAADYVRGRHMEAGLRFASRP